MKDRFIASAILIGSGLIRSTIIWSLYAKYVIEFEGFTFNSLKSKSPQLVTVLYFSYIVIAIGIVLFCSSFLKIKEKTEN